MSKCDEYVKMWTSDCLSRKVSFSFSVEWLPWCGLLMNTSSLELKVDYSRYSQLGEKYLQNKYTNSFEAPCHSVILSLLFHVVIIPVCLSFLFFFASLL